MNHAILESLTNISMGLLPARDDEKCHFTFILDGSYVVSMGVNLKKTHPGVHKLGYEYPVIHSEFDAYRKLPRGIQCSRLRMVNLRLSRSSIRTRSPILRMSKPCQYCLPWVTNCGFKEIWYTKDDGWYVL